MIGTTISHYKILEKIGDGGMGVVYKAQDTKLKRLVALKFLLPGSTHDPVALERFINEAQTASALDHANICTIYEINEHNPASGEAGEKQVFIAMAYYEGETVKNRLKSVPLSAEETIDITIQVAQGLERAHEAGIMHRDIKSENIIITKRGEAKILDFGIAKLSGRSVVTNVGGFAGTVAYMSPEQVHGEKVDHRTDIWSLGVTVQEMLTGQLPFEGEYNQAVMYAIVNETPQRLQTFRPELSPNLQIILDRALEKDPSDRYQSAREMISDLVGLSDGSLAESRTEVTKVESDKARYLPDYHNDIFVSYSYIDDKPLTKGHKGWIENFHNSLEIRLEQLLGEDTKIWRDDKINDKNTSHDDNSIAAPNAAILISMISPQYVKSKKCLQEVKGFYKAAEQGKGLWINNKARIFKAVKTYVPRESQPEELQNIPDYEFYRFDPVSGRPQEFWPELGAEANRNFWVKLEDIAYDIYLLMETIKKGETDSLQKKSDTDKAILYLAETTPDLAESRDEIRRQLQQRGHIILPDQQLISTTDSIQNQIQADLERCSISIHLVGKKYGLVPKGETRSIADIQHQLAINRSQDESFLRFIWIPPGLQPEDENQQKFVESLKRDSSEQKGAHILQTPIGEFQTFLKEKSNEKPGISGEKIIEDDILRIYLQCDQTDIDATDQLEEYLYDQGFEIKLPAFGGSELEIFAAHKENLLLCDATIIYYGNSTDSWLSAKLADLQKISGYGRSKPMNAKAIYLATPETKHKQRFRTREAITIKNFDKFLPDLLEPFLETIKNSRGEKS